MFKKLKAKIEEGGEVGIENVSFSERRVPGVAVRAQSSIPSTTLEHTPREHSRSPSPWSRNQDEGIAVSAVLPTTITSTPVSEVLPSHITSKPPSTYEALLESRIKQLEQECCSLKEGLNENKLEHRREVDQLTNHTEHLDNDRTELKLQIIELQLEKGQLETSLNDSEGDGRKREKGWEEERGNIVKQHTERVTLLEERITDKDKILLERGTRLEELESRTGHLLSRLTAFEESSENLVVKRLQAEVADLGSAIKARNIDIQILERRLALQTRGSQEEYGAVVDKHFSLESNYKEVSGQLELKRKENRQLVKDIQRETKALADKEKEVTKLQTQLTLQETKHNQLIDKLEELRSTNEKQVIEVDKLVLEKDERISELLTNLKQLRGESGSVHLPDGSVVASVGGVRPPGLARRMTTIGTQTSNDMNAESAVLPVNESLGGASVVLTNGERATMNSLGPDDELSLLREDQLRLEEEVSEKNKIIRVQQQKILDMKKTLTKELQRSQSIPDISNRDQHSPPPVRIQADVNFQYLKYVILKFISSRDEESSQLVRAISTLLEFTPQEEKYVKDYLDYKMSWFGAQPVPIDPFVNKT